MKKILLSAVATVALSATALAADLPARTYTKAPAPIIAAMYDWSGFYIGLNGGGGWSRKCWDITNNGLIINPPFREGCHDATGGVAGGQIGYRWQSSAWVFGLEAQGDWANLKGNNRSLFDVRRNYSSVDALGLLTVQIGYAWNNVLLYVKGGAAVVNDKYNGVDIVTGLTFDRADETRWGGAVGVGLEYGFTPNWSFAVEYDHLFFGSRDVTFRSTGAFIPAGSFSRTDRIGQDVDMVTARINYRFCGPVVAKY